MPDLEERIALVRDLKQFAVEEMRIAPNRMFEKVSRRESFYAIYCSRADKIEPAVNSQGLIAFYLQREWKDKRQWEKRIKKLSKQEIDIYPITCAALGFNGCPLTQSLLKAEKRFFSFAILHESAHIHNIKNRFGLHPSVDEALANAVAFYGCLDYFKANDPPMVGLMREFIENHLRFYDVINSAVAGVNQAYETGFQDGRNAMAEAGKQIRQNWIFGDIDINNAFFLSNFRYSEHTKNVWERLKSMHPKEYLLNKAVLDEKLAGLLPEAQNKL